MPNAIVSRRAIAYWTGVVPAPEVHSILVDGGKRRVVTWAEVMAARREQQAIILGRIRAVKHWEAWRCSVWWSPGIGPGFFSGYHAWWDRLDQHEWLRYGSASLMRLFPLVLPLAYPDSRDQWEAWKEAFVQTYPAGRKCNHPRGAHIVWRRGNETVLSPRGPSLNLEP